MRALTDPNAATQVLLASATRVQRIGWLTERAFREEAVVSHGGSKQ